MIKNASIIKGGTDVKKKRNIQQSNIEIINNLKHSLSKPTIVDAQRTLKIMDKLIDNLGIFLHLDSDFVMKFNDISNPQKTKLNKTIVQELSPETLELFVREAKLESELRPFGNIQQQMRDGEQVQEDRIAEYCRIKKDLENTFKTLVRALSKNKSDLEKVQSLRASSVPNSDIQFVQEALSNYKIIMQKKLATAAEEEEVHTRMLEELADKIKSLEKSRLNCEQELQRLRSQRSRHAEEKKEEIDKLRSEIREVKNNKEKQLERIKKETQKQADTLKKEHHQKQEKLNAEIAGERGKFNKMKEENLKEETSLKTRKAGGESTLQQNITVYDREMEAQHRVRYDLQRELKRLTDQLNNFKKHFQEIEFERQREDALIQEHRKRKEMYELVQKRKHEAANRIKTAFKMFKKKNKTKKKKVAKKA